jgi:hypothetical protein
MVVNLEPMKVEHLEPTKVASMVEHLEPMKVASMVEH